MNLMQSQKIAIQINHEIEATPLFDVASFYNLKTIEYATTTHKRVRYFKLVFIQQALIII